MWGCRWRTGILCRENKEQESEGKKQGVRRAMDTLVLFEKNYTEVWLIFSVALSSAAQQCESVIHINIYTYIYSYSFSWDLSLNIIYSSLCSTVGRCCFSFLCFPNTQSSPTPHPCWWQPHVLALFGFGWTLISPASEKTPWYLPKEGNNRKYCVESEYWEESPVRAHADWCVSLTPPGF